MTEGPDARYVLANERTLLAWLRTAIALMAAGFAAVELVDPSASLPVRWLIGVPLILLGAAAAVAGYRRWSAADAALRAGEILPRTHSPLLLTGSVVAVGLVALLFAVAGGFG